MKKLGLSIAFVVLCSVVPLALVDLIHAVPTAFNTEEPDHTELACKVTCEKKAPVFPHENFGTARADFRYVGTITVSDGGSVNNRTTAVPFSLGKAKTHYVVQCPDAGAWVGFGVGSVSVGTGLMLPAAAAVEDVVVYEAIDAGTYKSGLLSIKPLAGAADAQCIVTAPTGL